MSDCGIDNKKAMEIIREKKSQFDKDVATYESKWK